MSGKVKTEGTDKTDRNDGKAEKGLSEREISWLGAGPNGFEVAKANEKAAQRDELLTHLIGTEIKNARGAIEKANSDIKLREDLSKENITKRLFKIVTDSRRVYSWRVDPSHVDNKTDQKASFEADTHGDLVDIEALPTEKLNDLNASLDRILSVQNQMLSEVDKDGQRMFSDEDIRKELWNPLVRDGTIPSNLVPDRFSSQVHAMSGAAEVYRDMLKKGALGTSPARIAKEIFDISK
ncbi:MAG TPA: hypothetical protein VLA51_11165, partial [Paracoccaceae bacterium]|nr:hypothetical protein [Paracoccaceae bacterium]